MPDGDIESKIKDLLVRGVSAIYPTKEFLEDKLRNGNKLSIYLGIDPTAPTLHFGHSIVLLKLRQFQDLGHNVIILYGGFTAQIGDPTDRSSLRQPLLVEQIKKNSSNYKKFIGKILDLKKTNIKFLNNEKWSNKLKPVDMLNLASQFTVAQLLERDMFQERIKQGKEIHLHEFLYPVFQAYDAVTMNVDIQIGGNDQTFNMLAGRTLMRKLKNKEQAVISMKLLTDSSGKKMGKTEGNMVSLNETADQMFGKIMSWTDSMIVSGLELCTTLPMREIEAIKIKLGSGMNPRDAKLILAEEIVKIYHGKTKAIAEKKNFLNIFSKKEIPSDIIEIKVKRGERLVDILILAKTVSSKSEFHRLVEEGAVREISSENKITDSRIIINKNLTLKIGKHRFIKIIAE